VAVDGSKAAGGEVDEMRERDVSQRDDSGATSSEHASDLGSKVAGGMDGTAEQEKENYPEDGTEGKDQGKENQPEEEETESDRIEKPAVVEPSSALTNSASADHSPASEEASAAFGSSDSEETRRIGKEIDQPATIACS